MEFFSTLEKIIQIANPYKKIEEFSKFYAKYPDIAMDHSKESLVFTAPSFQNYCKVVDPKDVPRRARFGTTKGRAVLLHAIAHIEYSAIDLALDAAYRFKNMPKKFYDDWLEVAEDECRHFLMIDSLLSELGYKYGDFVVHQGLFDAGRATQTLLERMAVVPRYLEANGLDANPKIIKKLSTFKDPFAKKIIQALQTILNEEIGHVQKGDYWFKWACDNEGKEPIEAYFACVERIYPDSVHSKKEINVDARKSAGFSCDEIEMLAKERVQCG